MQDQLLSLKFETATSKSPETFFLFHCVWMLVAFSFNFSPVCAPDHFQSNEYWNPNLKSLLQIFSMLGGDLIKTDAIMKADESDFEAPKKKKPTMAWIGLLRARPSTLLKQSVIILIKKMEEKLAKI